MFVEAIEMDVRCCLKASFTAKIAEDSQRDAEVTS